MTQRYIYYLAAESDWQAAERAGVHHGSADDRRDGFIHFSAADQVVESAARHRAGRTDILLVTVDTGALGAALRWEESRGGALFPHLFGTLPLSAVTKVEPLPLDADGLHVFPALSGE